MKFVSVWISAAPHRLSRQTTEGLCPMSPKYALYLSVLWGVSPLIERLLLSYLLKDSLLRSTTLASYAISLPPSAFWVPLICKQTSPNVSAKPFCISLHTIALSSLLLGLGRSLQCWFTHAGLSLAPPSPHRSTLSHLTSVSTTLHTSVLA